VDPSAPFCCNWHLLGTRKAEENWMQTPFLRSENRRLHTIPSPLDNCVRYSRYVKENPSTRTGLLQTVQDLGLATEGSPGTLRARHERWCNLWNAEIDSIKPRTIGCLLQDITDWDRERSTVQESPKIEDADGYVVRKSHSCGVCFSMPTRRLTRINSRN
jgi:hypothetical protein